MDLELNYLQEPILLFLVELKLRGLKCSCKIHLHSEIQLQLDESMVSHESRYNPNVGIDVIGFTSFCPALDCVPPRRLSFFL